MLVFTPDEQRYLSTRADAVPRVGDIVRFHANGIPNEPLKVDRVEWLVLDGRPPGLQVNVYTRES